MLLAHVSDSILLHELGMRFFTKYDFLQIFSEERLHETDATSIIHKFLP